MCCEEHMDARGVAESGACHVRDDERGVIDCGGEGGGDAVAVSDVHLGRQRDDDGSSSGLSVHALTSGIGWRYCVRAGPEDAPCACPGSPDPARTTPGCQCTRRGEITPAKF